MKLRLTLITNLIPCGLAALFLALAAPASAQDAPPGALAGRVLDSTGAVVVGARVSVQPSLGGPGRAVETDAAGVYRVPDLPAGSYRVTATSPGFAPAAEMATIAAGVAHADLILRPGGIEENLTVVATQITGTPDALQRIPGSADVLDRRLLEVSRPFTFAEALRKAPGVYVRDEEGFGLRPSIGLRGLDPNRSAKVLLLEDGLPLGHAPYGDTDAYYHPPIERYDAIEVLKGSSQIAYGPMTIGGAINYLTPAPPDHPAASLAVTGGNRDYFNGHAAAGFPRRRTGLLLDYLRKQGRGAREHIRSDLQDVNVKSETRLADAQTLILKANYYGEQSNVSYSGLTTAEFLANPRQNPFLNDRFYGDRFGASATYTSAFLGDWLLTASGYTSAFSRDWWRQSSNSDQRPNDQSDPACGGMRNLSTSCGNEGRLRDYRTAGAEARLRFSHRAFGLRHETDFGGRIHDERQDRLQKNGDRPTSRDGVLVEDNVRTDTALSGYLQHRVLLGNWTLTPGARVEHVEIARANRLGAGASGETTITTVVPGVGLSFAPRPHTTIFAGVHRGFAPPRPSDIITNAGGVIELDAELSWNSELGVRSAPAPGVRVDATIFRMDYQNQIVPANLSGGIGSTLTSAGETLHQGFEVFGRIDVGAIRRSPHNPYVRVAYTAVPTAEYRGMRYSSVPGAANVSIRGHRLVYAPEHLLNLTLGYAHVRGLEAFVEAVYVSDQFSDDLNTVQASPNGQQGLIPGYTTWNATIGHRIRPLHGTVFFTVKNLLDDTFIVDRRRGVMVGSPRLVQAGVKVGF